MLNIVDAGQIDKSNVSDYHLIQLQDRELYDLKLQLAVACGLLYTCKRIDYLLRKVGYNVVKGVDDIYIQDKFLQGLYIDNMLVELYKLTEPESDKTLNYGIQTLKIFVDELIRRYNLNEYCDILAIFDKKINSVGTFGTSQSFTSLENPDDRVYNSADLALIQYNELSKIRETVSELRNIRCKVQAHQDLSHLEEVCDQISVDEIVSNIANKEYIINNINIDCSINDFWHTMYRAYDTIRRALDSYVLLLLSVYSRQEDKKEWSELQTQMTWTLYLEGYMYKIKYVIRLVGSTYSLVRLGQPLIMLFI